MVDRRAVDRLLLERADQAGRADLEGEVRGLRNPVRSQANARWTLCRHPAALRGRSAHGRSHASAGAAVLWDVWRAAAEPERGADPYGSALEVRIQEHQIHREDPVRREAAANHLEHP